MLFFQLALLLGYLYAHWLHTRRARTQALTHIGLLALSLVSLPILPGVWWKTAGGPPSLRILALLAITVGAPYFLLASTSPLLQSWYARTHKHGFPYRLFALSNLCSMLALLSYPLLIEPNIATRAQGYVWSAAYALFAIACSITAWRACNHPALTLEPEVAPLQAPATTLSTRFLWLALSASASLLLLAITNHLTQDVASIPFLWILPLAVYLLTFIICFEAPRFYRRAVFVPLLPPALGVIAYSLVHAVDIEIRMMIALLGAALFVCCMACHGELVRLKPDPKHLTGFYLTISVGGAVGGLFVGMVAPNVFNAYYELPLSLLICAFTLGWIYCRDSLQLRPTFKYAAIFALAVAIGYDVFYLGGAMRNMTHGYVLAERNFYGQLRVLDEGDPSIQHDASRTLMHGAINHGVQFLAAEYRRSPVTYFCPETGIGRAMRATEGAPRHLGVLGLGCGTLAAYSKAGDSLRIYEINPQVIEIANHQFTYLADSPAKVSVALGDGRLSLEAERSQQFDVLVMDAFSGDSVPVHLLTVEAFQTYFRHLKSNGILAVNVTNRFLDLNPVIERAATAMHKVALTYSTAEADDNFLCYGCDWALIMDRDTLNAHLGLGVGATELKPYKSFRTWTDDFSTMYGILK